MLGADAASVAIGLMTLAVAKLRPPLAIPGTVVAANLLGLVLNAYHSIVGAPVAPCVWTLTGLLASAAVQNPAQATLALPMLCFPQVLFAGAVVAIGEMSVAAQAMSVPLAGRWGFESLGRILDVDEQIGSEAAAVGYVDSFTGSPVVGWAVLVIIVSAALAGTVVTLRRRTRA